MNLARRRAKRRVGVWDMTPMIDVVLQLIIFFMYTAQFSAVVRTRLDLPPQPGDEADAAGRSALVIDVRADGSYLVSGEPVGLARIASMLSAEIAAAEGDADAVRPLVRADQSAPASAVNDLAKRLGDMGVRGWRLGTQAVPHGGAD